MDDFRLGVAQLTSTEQTSDNLLVVEKLLARAVEQKINLLVFPENTLYFRIAKGRPIAPIDAATLERLSALVTRGGSTAVMLTTPARDGQSAKLRNSTFLLQPGHPPQMVYNKIHMFDVDVEGAPPVRESDSFANGDSPKVVEIDGWKFGLSICYDLRFAELYAHYAQKVDVILVPSAFLVPTGAAHWHVLLRARAIENQCYVAAPAQSGEHLAEDQSRQTYGHSLIVDPWGKVLTELTASPDLGVVELKREAIARVRRQIPMSSHRRLR